MVSKIKWRTQHREWETQGTGETRFGKEVTESKPTDEVYYEDHEREDPSDDFVEFVKEEAAKQGLEDHVEVVE